ncbi:MAG: hypothetical protein EOO01_11945 [Chitinophagaceae bacterium]|nr:MAG: hypothetical protein EOO01_11945 [Chitinophagaceae bacterium]
MKSLLLYVSFSLLLMPAFAQPTNEKGWYDREDIQDTEIGWIKVFQFKEPAKPFAQHGWSYPANQTNIAQQIATWMQQTITPRGLLGEMVQSVLAPEPSASISSSSYTYNEAEKNNRNALPNTYGAFAKFYMHLQKTSTKKFWPINGLADYFNWNIMANNLQLITVQMVNLSSPDEYYCTMPKYTIGMKGEYEKDWNIEYANYRDFTNSPRLKNYEHYLIPSRAIDQNNQSFYTVIMTKDNQPLPLEQVTVGQLIARLEKQLPLMYKIAINNGSRVANLMENAQRGIRIMKQKFSNKLNEYVYINGSTALIDLIDISQIEEGKDIHWLRTQATTAVSSNYTTTNFPLLKLKKGVKESLAKSGPQWIVCRLTKGGTAGDGGEIHLMETFINRFNYDYVYDYFFGKEKTIKPYAPLPFASTEEKNNKQAALPLSDEAKKMALDKSVLYFEDFSSTATGALPANWKTQRSEITGEHIAVVEVNGSKQKWLKLKRTASPSGITLPLTGNFTLSFDILVQKGDVPWGTPGIALVLGSGDKPARSNPYRFGIDVSPGDMNRKDAAGWVSISRSMPPGSGDCTISSYYSLPDFTGSKVINKVTMAIRREGEKVTVLCNDKKVFECDKGISGDISIKTIQFEVNEKNVYHISNILVKR